MHPVLKDLHAGVECERSVREVLRSLERLLDECATAALLISRSEAGCRAHVTVIAALMTAVAAIELRVTLLLDLLR
jgi:hypothetical protein